MSMFRRIKRRPGLMLMTDFLQAVVSKKSSILFSSQTTEGNRASASTSRGLTDCLSFGMISERKRFLKNRLESLLESLQKVIR